MLISPINPCPQPPPQPFAAINILVTLIIKTPSLTQCTAMIRSGKYTLLRLLIWVCVASLLFGLLIFRNGQLSSHQQDTFSISSAQHEDQLGYNAQELKVEPDPILCEEGNEELPLKHLIFWKRAEHYRTRRLMRSEVETAAFHEGQQTSTSTNTQSKNVEAVFHVDYSSPKTHPPKNN